VNLGQIRFRTGYLSDAIRLWTSAWQLAKAEKGRPQIAVANKAIANLLILDARLGRTEELTSYLDEIKKRPFYGSDEEKIAGAKEGAGYMRTTPGLAYKCGPYALNTLLNLDGKQKGENPILKSAQSTREGTNLAQLKEWADQVGLKYRLAKRSAGAPFVYPALVHWRLDHFGALVRQEGSRYVIKDRTFDSDAQIWLSAKALEQETDGYFLVPENQPLPDGWQPLSVEEASKVYGKGNATWHAGQWTGCASNQGCTTQHCKACIPTSASSCPGMPIATVNTALCTLHISDVPMAYTPPLGKDMKFGLTYSHLEMNEPSSFSFTNVGHDWNFGWCAYLTVDPVSSVATVRLRGGGSEICTPSGGVYPPDFLSLATLENMGSGVYHRTLPDGTVEVYDQADSASPPRIFLTQVIDPQGQSTLIQYDSDFRITTITDAISQVSTVSYVSNTSSNPGFYKIAGIQDPFGRSFALTYDAAVENLIEVTDVIGMKSQFAWDTGTSFISQMTTEYGTTSFYNYVPGVDLVPARGLRFTLPDKSAYVIENWLNEPKSTYIWDRHTIALYPNDPVNKDYSHCEKMRWTYNNDTGQQMPALQELKHPLETASVYIRHPGQPTINYSGTSNLPTEVKQDLGNMVVDATIGGTVTPGYGIAFLIDYVYAGYTPVSGDTLADVARELAHSVNTNSDYQSRGITAGACGNVVSLKTEQVGLTRYNYYAAPGATETISFLSHERQTATGTLTGTITSGDLVTIFVYPGSLYGVTISYTVQPGDTASTICTNMAASLNANATWQSYQGNAVARGGTIDFECYPHEPVVYAAGGSGTELFAYSSYRNGTVQLRENSFNDIGNLTKSVDPAGRTFSYSYDTNKIDLLEARETQGSDNYLLGHWEYNSQHEPVKYIDGSAQETDYVYNSSGQLISVTDADSKTTTLQYTGTASATISGTVTNGNVLTITVHDAGLSGGQKSKSYTVTSGNTLTDIASGLASAINGDTDLQGIGVSSSSAGAVVTLTSHSTNVTTYTQSTSGGATEVITLGANTYGYLTQINGPLAGDEDITTFQYDGYGRLYSVTDSEGYTLVYEYDALNRPTKTTYPDGTFEKTAYARLDAVLETDRNGRATQSAFDSLGQLSFEIDAMGRKTQYGWCTCGSLSSLIDPAGNTTTWSHDIQGRQTLKTYADSSTVSYVYEQKTSRLKRTTDALSQKKNFFWNNDGSLYQKSYPNPVNPTADVSSFWDYNFKRLTKVTKNDWGSYSYTYNNYVTSSGATPITGGGRLQLVHNDVIANSDVTYAFDALGRTTNRSINGSSNSIDWTYDAMSRVTSEDNALGTFNYAYVDDTSGSSKGTSRLASITYPNSQVTKFDWYPNQQDQRLQQISNLAPSGATISQFNYRYDPAGQIKQWQQLQGNTSLNYGLGYDQAGQLVDAAASGGVKNTKYLKQEHFAYDLASNRTGNQNNTVTRARFSGSATAGNVLTITTTDSGLSGGSVAVSYTVQSGDTLAVVATKLAEAIAVSSSLQSIGVTAASDGSILSIKSSSPNVTAYAATTSGGATASIAMGYTDNFVENAVIGGTKTTGDVLTLTFKDAALSGGQKSINYTVLSGDNLTSIATAIKTAINADTDLQALAMNATSVGTALTIKSTSSNATTYAQSVSTGATETIVLSINQNGPMRIGVGGSKTTGDTVSIVAYDSGLTGGTETASYTVQSGDNLSAIAAGLAASINANTDLQSIGVSASSSGQVLTVSSNSINETTYRGTTSSTATEIVSIDLPPNGTQTAVIGGTKTTGDVLTLTVYDAGLSGGSEAVAYTVLSGDTLTSIATNLTAAVNANTNLQAVNVSATSSGTVVFVKSNSLNATTYAKSLSGGATETIALAPSTSASLYGYNNLNELTSIATGGPTKFEGNANKALTAASVNSNAANLPDSLKFDASPSLSSGTNTVPVAVTDANSTTVTNNYRESTNGSASATPTYDANGNMTSDGINSYVWDAEDRLVNINYPGFNNFSLFAYDVFSRNVLIEEATSGSVTSRKQFVWTGLNRKEERDESGLLIKRFLAEGQLYGSTKYFYAQDHLGSVHEMTDDNGAIHARYLYSPYGETTAVSQSVSTDFSFSSYYVHSRSSLCLSVFRQYSSLLARWLNRDPIGENGGVNLNGYCGNSPITWSDPTGLLWEQENRVNCLGSACGRGHWAGPDEGKSVASAMSEMGYSCTKIDPPADSKSCDCKGQDTVLLTFGPENDMKDPYNDPFHYDPENFSNDFHAFHLKSRGINGKQDQWQVQNGDAAKGSPEDNFRTFDGMPEGERTFIPFSSIYCCCKCPSAGKGGK
jgi:RHS repeat-associated protein